MIDKLRLFLYLLCATLFIASCGGGGEVVTPSNLAKASISDSGDVTYAGISDFTGVRLVGTGLISVSGGTMEIVKSDSSSEVSASAASLYVPVGPSYEITFYDKTGNKVTASGGSLAITVPYNPSVLSRLNAGAASVVLLNEATDGSVAVLSGTVDNVSGVITVAASVTSNPLSFFTGIPRVYKPVQSILPLISASYEGYNTAMLNRAAFTDPQGVKHPDWAKGRNTIQVGGRALLIARQTDALGEVYTSFNWQITSKPSGSSASIILLADNKSQMQIIVDKIGNYVIQLTATGHYGTDTETYTVKARNLTYAKISGSPTNLCVLCHSGKLLLSGFENNKDIYGRQKLRDMVTPWQASVHGKAFDAVKDNASSLCMECHTTGFLFADRNGDGTDDFPESQGYDSFIADWTKPNTDQGNSHLRGVTCEACHGPGGNGGLAPDGSGLSHEYKANISVGPCVGCHEVPDNIPAHPQDLDDFHYNAHEIGGGIVMKTDPCFQCHVGQAFIYRTLNNGAKLKPSDVTDPKGVTCATCHDPHNEKKYPYSLRLHGDTTIQVRLYDNTTLQGTDVIKSVNAGLAAVCYNCHNANVILPNDNMTYDPRGNESLMIEGVGGWEYGDASPVAITHGYRVTDKCVTCHMTSSTGVTHKRLLYNPSTGGYNTAGCLATGCHVSDNSTGMALPTTGDRFDFKGKRTEIGSLMTQLQARINSLIGRNTGDVIKINYTASEAAGVSADKLKAINRAAYNYLFIFRDNSGGVHNYPYAKKLLALSLNDLLRF